MRCTVTGKKFPVERKFRATNFEIKTGQKRNFGYKWTSDQTLTIYPDDFGNGVGTQNRSEVKTVAAKKTKKKAGKKKK
jgi:hypothetical protein